MSTPLRRGDHHDNLSGRSQGNPHPQYLHKALGGTISGPINLGCPVVVQGDCTGAFVVEDALGNNAVTVDTNSGSNTVTVSAPTIVLDYSVQPGASFNIHGPSTGTSIDMDEFGNLTMTGGSVRIGTDITPGFGVTRFFPANTDSTDIGSGTKRFRTVFAETVDARGLTLSFTTQTGNYSVGANDVVVLHNHGGTGTETVTLPDATTNTGRVIWIKDVSGLLDFGSSVIQQLTATAGNLDGSATQDYSAAYSATQWTSDGTDWWRLNG